MMTERIKDLNFFLQFVEEFTPSEDIFFGSKSDFLEYTETQRKIRNS